MAKMSSLKQLLSHNAKTMRNFANLFKKERKELYNLVIKVVMPDAMKSDFCHQSVRERALNKIFAKDRIHPNKVN